MIDPALEVDSGVAKSRYVLVPPPSGVPVLRTEDAGRKRVRHHVH
jgi:hypothetical protein